MKLLHNFRLLPQRRRIHYELDEGVRIWKSKRPYIGVAIGIAVLAFLPIKFGFKTPPVVLTKKHSKIDGLPDLNHKEASVLSLITQKNATGSNSTSASIDIQAVLASTAHRDIITTIFWTGEASDASNGYIPNDQSAWDESWMSHYGGIDDPNNRTGYLPSGFTPNENPFYFALPYNDVDANDKRRPNANLCPNSSIPSLAKYSWCKNSWIAIKHGDKIVYAQWEDVGPNEENDGAYVLGTSKPKNTFGAHAGLDVSPAVRDYLGLQDVDKCDWSFVASTDVPDGPWKQIVTTSRGYNY